MSHQCVATTLEFQIAVAPLPGAQVTESLMFVLDGKPVEPLEIRGAHGGQLRRNDCRAG